MDRVSRHRRRGGSMLGVLAAATVVGLFAATSPAPSARAQERPHAVLLVATKAIVDPNFAETVVLVTHQALGGAIGVILNRPTDARVADVLTRESLKDRTDVVFRGGPVVRGALVLAFRSPAPPPTGDVGHVLDDVYLTLDPRVIDAVLGGKDLPRFRLYAGYAGWAPGQLEAEILQGGWFVLDADADSVFTENPPALWRTLLQRASGHPQTRAPDDRPPRQALAAR